ncbi:MAG: TIGR04282 family arsenosugar biosynthesis glycosyltransferase [Bacteroidota bacterium]
MHIVNPHEDKKDPQTVHLNTVAMKDLLLIFTRNPQLGKVKTRLAATVGDQTALEIYKFLLQHTFTITKELQVAKEVHYSEKIADNDIWDKSLFTKKVQLGADLGKRMHHAFQSGFESGFERVMIIGSDMYDLSQEDLENAFALLKEYDYVLGPALDGGYYLFGMRIFTPEVFHNKAWGSESVLSDTLKELEGKKVKLLEARNDIDVFEDIKDKPVFKPFLK